MDLETFLWIYLVGAIVFWLLLCAAFGLKGTTTITLSKPWYDTPRKWKVPNLITVTGAGVFWLPYLLLCVWTQFKEKWSKIERGGN